jgi:hypothetical protein
MQILSVVVMLACPKIAGPDEWGCRGRTRRNTANGRSQPPSFFLRQRKTRIRLAGAQMECDGHRTFVLGFGILPLFALGRKKVVETGICELRD